MMKKPNFLSVLTLAIISLFLCMDSAYAELDQHTVAAWTFDEGEGDIVKDVSGNGHDGELLSGAEWSKDGKFGGERRIC